MELKRIELPEKYDERGRLIEIFKGGALERENWGQVYLFTVNPGVTRGNHYHTAKNEWFHLASGKADLILQDTATGERTVIELDEGRPESVFIPAGTAHAVHNQNPFPALIIAYIDQEFDPGFPDTHFLALG
jgi:dTDP-4-dehydrorhamnose 3,5-epimerase-like enzyme